MTEQRKAVIKNADMSEDMQQEAVDCASQALSKYNIEKVSEREGQDTAETAACGNWLALEFRDNASTPHGARGANNSQRGFAVERMGGWWRGCGGNRDRNVSADGQRASLFQTSDFADTLHG